MHNMYVTVAHEGTPVFEHGHKDLQQQGMWGDGWKDKQRLIAVRAALLLALTQVACQLGDHIIVSTDNREPTTDN